MDRHKELETINDIEWDTYWRDNVTIGKQNAENSDTLAELQKMWDG